jgi:hypothetical protein
LNITAPTKSAVQELITQCYIDNARIDRMKSVLLADLSYNETADVVHKYIAHYFSNGIGDDLSEKCLERYNISVVFGGIPVMDKQYNTVEEVLNELLEIVIDFQNQLSMCIKIAMENMDKQIVSDLLSFNVYYNNIVDQCILLVDKIKLYKDNPSFDAHLKDHFFILGDK